MSAPRVLVGCEFSGTVRRAFQAVGCEAWSCDLIASDDNSPFHFQGDIAEMLKQKWDLGIFHPPCTYLANSGVCWLAKDHTGTRRAEMIKGAAFFNSLLNADIPRICVENPIQHGEARGQIRLYTQIIQPWMFGHMEQKATCLWLKNLPKLQPTDNVHSEMMKLAPRERQRLHYLPPSADRWKIRSTTFQGIATAMATQWGPLL